MSNSRKVKILVIGGGGGGVATAQALSKSVDPQRVSIQLVTERPFYVFWPALLRVVVTSEGQIEKDSLLNYDKIFAPGKAGEVVVGEVTNIEDGVAHLADGAQLSYDYLVLATGTIWNGPLAFPKDVDSTKKFISEWRSAFARANNIVIVGGGSVGFELAGEIRHFLPSKNVTIVHSQALPLNSRYPDKFRKAALDKSRAAGVNWVLGDRLTVPEGQYTSVTTEKGNRLAADLVVPVVGGKPNTQYLRSFDPTVLTTKGTVRVQPTLQVSLHNGKTNVYAVGDIIEWDEEKQLAKVAKHVEVVVANILASINKSGAKPKTYGGFMEAIGIPIGPKGGLLFLPMLGGITMGDFFTRKLKSQTLMVEMAKKALNLA